FKTVVEEVGDEDLQISLPEAVELDPEAVLDDVIGVKLDSNEFGRIDAQTAKQIIIQKVRDAERDIVFKEYTDKKGEIITGIVHRFERGDIIVDLGRAEAILPKKEQVRREGYRQGERIRGIVLDVLSESRGPQVVLSRTHPGFLIKLFQMEVPEVYEGIVEIKGAAREPGDRAKIAVVSNNYDVDPVGACVGVKGSRVQAVVQELKGEKIDIIHWSEEAAIYVKNTLSPAVISKVITDSDEHAMEVVVPDDQLSLAIGKKGQNVRLAAKLTGWKIDIRTETDGAGGESLSPEEALRKEIEASDAREEAKEKSSNKSKDAINSALMDALKQEAGNEEEAEEPDVEEEAAEPDVEDSNDETAEAAEADKVEEEAAEPDTADSEDEVPEEEPVG
ncbi:MAG: transcription termination/antitermination protein NusA, partial [Proteobacteria bacterium]|nr:transcription termination/antitermination protein NusA [Pseudomonadota bacterium]